jgi:hypothetical protein
VVGPILIVIALLLIPVLVIMGGAIASAIIGQVEYLDGRARNPGSELLDLPD